jgi:O-antigen/teichoic acid export membrane protein
MQIRNLIESAIRAIMPAVSRMRSLGVPDNMQKVKAIYITSLRLVWGFGAPIFLVFMVFAPYILKFWLHQSFTGMIVPTFQILLIGTFFSLLSVPAYYMLMGCHGITHCFFSTVIQAFINVVSALVMIFMLRSINIYALAVCVALSHIGASAYIIIQMRRCVTPNLFPGRGDAQAF